MSENFKLSIEIVAAVGSIMSGIVMLITLIQVITRLKIKNEVIYGDEATERYEKIKNTILEEKGIEIKSKYEGGNNKIIPRLEVEKYHFNPILMKQILKGYKIRVRYFVKENDQRIVHTWYLK